MSDCISSVGNNVNPLLCNNIDIFRNTFGITSADDLSCKSVIRAPRLSMEQHMIIKQLQNYSLPNVDCLRLMVFL